jgi:hypothetical protein
MSEHLGTKEDQKKPESLENGKVHYWFKSSSFYGDKIVADLSGPDDHKPTYSQYQDHFHLCHRVDEAICWLEAAFAKQLRVVCDGIKKLGESCETLTTYRLS